MKKMMLLLFSFGIITGIFGQKQADTPLRMTLEECLEYAARNNYNRQSVKLNEDVRSDQYNQSRTERLPDLSASVSENLSHTKGSSASWDGSYGISSNMTLYQGGNLNQSIKKSQLQAEQAVAQTEQYDNELTIMILQSFLTTLGNEELLKYQQSVLQTSIIQVKQGKDRLEAGEILESDYLLLEAQQATDYNNVAQTIINRDNNLLELKNLLSIDPVQPFEIIYPDTSALEIMQIMPSEEVVLERSINNMPDLRIADYSVEIAISGLKISKSAYLPVLSLNGSVGSGHNKNFSGYGDQLSDKLNEKVGLTLSIPIFNKNRTKSSVTQKRIALEQAELDRKQTELDIRKTILQEYRNVVSASGKYKTTTISRNAREESFGAYQAKYEAGSITTVDLLQQQNNYISAVNDYVQSKYEFMLKRKILDVYMGEQITM